MRMKIFYLLCFRALTVLFKFKTAAGINDSHCLSPSIKERPPWWQLVSLLRLNTGVFSFFLTLIGFKILNVAQVSGLLIAFTWCGITWSVMVWNDLLDRDHDTKKGKSLAYNYPRHVWKIWKWVSGCTLLCLIVTGIISWPVSLFSLAIWILGLMYSTKRMPYPWNNLIVALCSMSPLLSGSLLIGSIDIRILHFAGIIFVLILMREAIKDIGDMGIDRGYKVTFATLFGQFGAGIYALVFWYFIILLVYLYPDDRMKLFVWYFPINVGLIGAINPQFQSIRWLLRAVDLFLVVILGILINT